MCSGSKLRQVWVCPGHLQHRQTSPSHRHGVLWGPAAFFPNEFPHLLWHRALRSSSLGAWQNARSSCTDLAGFLLCDFGQASLPLWAYVSSFAKGYCTSVAGTPQGLDSAYTGPGTWEACRKWQLELTITAMPWTEQNLYTHLTQFPEHLLWAGHVSVLEDRVNKTEEVPALRGVSGGNGQAMNK